MKILVKILIILAVIAGICLLAKNEITKMAVKMGVKMATGLDSRIGKADVGLSKTTIGFYDFTLNNPSKYQDRLFITLPEIFVDYNLHDIMHGTMHMEDVRINLSELVIIKNADGTMNFQDIKTPPPAKETSPGEQPKVQIDHFSLKLGKVIYKDYSRGTEPKVKEYVLNINESFENVTGAQSLIPVLTRKIFLTVQKILINSSISDLSNIGGDIKGQMGNLIGDVSGLGKEIDVTKVKEGVTAAKDKIKGLFQ